MRNADNISQQSGMNVFDPKDNGGDNDEQNT